VKKVFTPVGITFKGNGFYKTDSRGSKNGSSSSGSKSTDLPSARSQRTRRRPPRLACCRALGPVRVVHLEWQLVQGEGRQQPGSSSVRVPALAPAATRTEGPTRSGSRRGRGLRRVGVLRVPRRRHRGRASTRPTGRPRRHRHRHGGRPSSRLPATGTGTSSSPPPSPPGPTWAMRALGVRSIVAPCSAGSLPRAAPATSWSSTSSSTAPGAGPSYHETRRPTTSPSPIPTTNGSATPCSRPVGPADHHARRRDRRRDPRPSLQHPGRVPLVPPDTGTWST
jgi:hypothetical protein